MLTEMTFIGTICAFGEKIMTFGMIARRCTELNEMAMSVRLIVIVAIFIVIASKGAGQDMTGTMTCAE